MSNSSFCVCRMLNCAKKHILNEFTQPCINAENLLLHFSPPPTQMAGPKNCTHPSNLSPSFIASFNGRVDKRTNEPLDSLCRSFWSVLQNQDHKKAWVILGWSRVTLEHHCCEYSRILLGKFAPLSRLHSTTSQCMNFERLRQKMHITKILLGVDKQFVQRTECDFPVILSFSRNCRRQCCNLRCTAKGIP